MLFSFIVICNLFGTTPVLSSTSNKTGPIKPLFTSLSLNNAIESTYNFKFYEADSYISGIDSTSKIDKEVAYLNQNWWIGLTYSGTSEILKNLEKYASKLQIEYSEPITSQEVFLKVLAGAFLIRISAIKGDRSLALKAFIRISSDLKKILKEPTSNQEYMLLAGVYHYAAGGIKQNFYWLKPFFIFLPNTNINLGKIYLTECAKSHSNIINTEAQYFLYKIENEIYNSKQKARDHIDWLVNKYPNNIIYALDQLRLKKGNGDKIQPLRIELIDKIHSSNLSKQQQDHFLELLNKI